MRVLRPLVAERLDLEPGGVDDGLVLVGVQRADRVDDRAARLRALGRGAQQLELQLGQRARAPAQVGTPREHAEPRARRVDERTVEARLVELAQVGGRRRGRSAASASPSPCAARVELDRRHLAGSITDLPPGAAHASRIRSPSCEPTTSAASCDARLIGRMRAGSTCSTTYAPGHVGRLADGLVGAHLERGRLVLRAHQRERLLVAEVALPDVGDPVGIRVLDRAFGQRRDEPVEPVASRRMTAFVNGTARSRRAARTSSTASSTTACTAWSVHASW